MTIAEHLSPSSAPALLDVADGVDRLMGDRALYARVLRRFRDDYRHGAARIGAAVDSGDMRLAHRMAHTLKGASGMISAPALQRRAGLLEVALRGDGARCHAEAIDALDAALDAVLQAIEPVLAGEPAPPRTPAPAATQPGQALVARLAALLANGDGAAIDLIDEHGACLQAALGAPGYAALMLAANEFDFEGALEALRCSGR